MYVYVDVSLLLEAFINIARSEWFYNENDRLRCNLIVAMT